MLFVSYLKSSPVAMNFQTPIACFTRIVLGKSSSNLSTGCIPFCLIYFESESTKLNGKTRISGIKLLQLLKASKFKNKPLAYKRGVASAVHVCMEFYRNWKINTASTVTALL